MSQGLILWVRERGKEESESGYEGGQDKQFSERIPVILSLPPSQPTQPNPLCVWRELKVMLCSCTAFYLTGSAVLE